MLTVCGSDLMKYAQYPNTVEPAYFTRQMCRKIVQIIRVCKLSEPILC